MSDHSHENLHELLAEIFDTPVGARHELIEVFLREHRQVLLNLSSRIIRQFSIPADWHDDVHQIVATEAWTYLEKPLKDGFDVSSTLPCIKVAARSAVSRMRQSSAYTGVSGAVAVLRRESALAKHRLDLIRTLGHEPDDQSLIESYNAKVIASRGMEKAKSQGALVTMADLHPRVGAANLDFEDDSKMPTSPDRLGEVEVREVIAEIIRRCEEESQDLGAIARAALLRSAAEQPGDMETSPGVLSAAVKVSLTESSRMLHQVKAVAIDVLDEWSLNSA